MLAKPGKIVLAAGAAAQLGDGTRKQSSGAQLALGIVHDVADTAGRLLNRRIEGTLQQKYCQNEEVPTHLVKECKTSDKELRPATKFNINRGDSEFQGLCPLKLQAYRSLFRQPVH